MTESKEPITAVKNSADLNQLEEQYKEKIADLEQKALDWENAAINEKKAKDDMEEDYKVKLKTTEQEKDEWKNKAHAAQRVYQSQERTKKESNFLAELSKLQAKKGINLEIQEINE